jgi:murein DD-endopeptidase MepM/ murein hydrolase activator NlpD
MSHKKALLASSLTVCSASTSFAVSSHEGSVAYAEDYLQQLPSHPSPKMELNESTQQYLKPVTMDLVDQSIQKSSKSITYKVKKGDTLYQIGLFFGIHYQDLAEFNHIVDPRKLQVGQELVIPLQIEEIPIDKPMTVPQLAKAYHTTVELMVYLNPIFQEQTVTEKGQWIAVPKKMKRAYRKLHQPLPQTQKLPRKKAKRKVVVFPESTTPKPSSYLFCWPVKGQITSKFGWRHGRQHKGIDIWNVAQSRALIYASKAGVVTRAGYTNGYGNLVVIDHGNGWVTYYAHLSKIRVGKGQRIETGQVVGNMGKTGNATGYHLHFEIRKNGEAINPLSMLP